MRPLVLATLAAVAVLGPLPARADDPRPPTAPPAEPLPKPVEPSTAPPEPPAAAARPSVPDPDPWLSVSGATLNGVSRDGATVLVRMPREGVPQLYRVGADGGWPHRVTFRPDGVDFASLSPDGATAIVGWDRDGDEDFGLYVVDVARPGPERPLRVLPKVQHGEVVWSREGDRVYFRDNADGAQDFHLREMRIADGALRTVLSRPGSWGV